MNGNKKHIGIMGGTFDPIHNAHIALAKQAYEQFSLDGVWILPNGNPPHKRDIRQADVQHRMEMAALAIQDISCLALCDIECSSEGYHYTYETLRQLNERYPDIQFYFIMGADSLFEFEDWRKPEIISQECILLAAARDCHREQVQEQIAVLKERFHADIRILDTPNMDISSEDIRRKIRDGETIQDMVPAAVADYIRKKKLYQSTKEV